MRSTARWPWSARRPIVGDRRAARAAEAGRRRALHGLRAPRRARHDPSRAAAARGARTGAPRCRRFRSPPTAAAARGSGRVAGAALSPSPELGTSVLAFAARHAEQLRPASAAAGRSGRGTEVAAVLMALGGAGLPARAAVRGARRWRSATTSPTSTRSAWSSISAACRSRSPRGSGGRERLQNPAQVHDFRPTSSTNSGDTRRDGPPRPLATAGIVSGGRADGAMSRARGGRQPPGRRAGRRACAHRLVGCLPRPDGDPVFSALLSARGRAQHRRRGRPRRRPPTWPPTGRAGTGASGRRVRDRPLRRDGSEPREACATPAVLATTLRDAHGNALRVLDFCPRFRSRGRMFRPMTLGAHRRPLPGGRWRASASSRPANTAPGGRWCAPARTTRASAASRLARHHRRVAGPILEGRPEVIERPTRSCSGPTTAEAPLSLARHGSRRRWSTGVTGRALAIPFEWQDAVIRAAITLALRLRGHGRGAGGADHVDPRGSGDGRNWDYRYCWRDAYFVVQALNWLGTTRTMEHLLHFLDHTVAHDEVALQPLYGVGGGAQFARARSTRWPATAAWARCASATPRTTRCAARRVRRDPRPTQMFFDQRLSSPGDHATSPASSASASARSRCSRSPTPAPGSSGDPQCHTFSALMSSGPTCDKDGADRDPPRAAGTRGRWRERASR